MRKLLEYQKVFGVDGKLFFSEWFDNEYGY